ncbi:hypothetical protein V8J36_06895 [Frigidibacter sp. MR17.14]|uniref:hypothetical protein n=1 Tax=Frigidibacter sp. MR17.14 TaxID=3126509 RepID=UPI0030130770
MYDAPAATDTASLPVNSLPVSHLPVSVRLKLPAQQARALSRWLALCKLPGSYALERDPAGGRQCHRLSLRTPQDAVDVIEIWRLQLWA